MQEKLIKATSIKENFMKTHPMKSTPLIVAAILIGNTLVGNTLVGNALVGNIRVADAAPASAPQANATKVSTSPSTDQITSDFAPFTGRVMANRVRLRLQPSIEGPIYKELDAGELFVVTGLHDDYYAVIPPADVKGYLFRMYVLEGVVEGQNVNLRLEPDTNAPILTQFHAGDKVDGIISAKNNKWLEIKLPPNVRFYISKDYIEKVGDKNYFQKIESERRNLQAEIDKLQAELGKEFAKPFRDIQLAPLATKVHSLQKRAADFPKEKEAADLLFKDMQNEYLQLSLVQEVRPIDVPETHQQELEQQKISHTSNTPAPAISSYLQQQEQQLVAAALAAKIAPTEEQFYQQELHKARALRGVVVRYDKAVKNRPGDFMLVDPISQVPQAFLYSTQVDLSTYEGKAVRLKGTNRANNHFALPAFFVLEVNELN